MSSSTPLPLNAPRVGGLPLLVLVSLCLVEVALRDKARCDAAGGVEAERHGEFARRSPVSCFLLLVLPREVGLKVSSGWMDVSVQFVVRGPTHGTAKTIWLRATASFPLSPTHPLPFYSQRCSPARPSQRPRRYVLQLSAFPFVRFGGLSLPRPPRPTPGPPACACPRPSGRHVDDPQRTIGLVDANGRTFALASRKARRRRTRPWRLCARRPPRGA